MDSNNSHNSFPTRKRILYRFFVVLMGAFSFALLISFKCCQTTVLNPDYWRALNAKYMERQIASPLRGDILAADSTVLATTTNLVDIRIDYRAERFNEKYFNDNIDLLCDSLATYFPSKTAEEWKSHLTAPLSLDCKQRPRAHLIERKVPRDLYRKFRKSILTNQLGIYSYGKAYRLYPQGNLAHRTIGFAIERSNKLNLHGVCGIEKGLNSLLRGEKGRIGSPEPVNGATIVTTINTSLQKIVHNQLDSMLHLCQAEWGTAILMEVETGDIVAIANLDSVDGQYIELHNHAVLNYEPGSTFNTISMTLAIEDNLAPDTCETIDIAPYAYAGGNPITDANNFQPIKIAEILERASNVGPVKIMHRKYDLTPSDFKTRLEQCGFFEPHNTGIAGETTPYMPSVENNSPGRIALSRQFIGYNIEVSPLSLLAWYNSLANDGKYVRPRLIKSISGDAIDSTNQVTYINPTLCSAKTASIMREMLAKVVWGQHGTARILRNDQVKIAGKTGTGYIVKDNRYDMAKRRVSFTGYFPADNPKYSCIVVINAPSGRISAAQSSGIVAKNIALNLKDKGLLD